MPSPAAWLAGCRVEDVREWADRDRVLAYEHPYGFMVVRLAQAFAPGWQIRMHLWPPKAVQEERMRMNGTHLQQVHAHGWHLWSRVLLGVLDEAGYTAFDEPGSPLAAYSVSSDYGRGSSRLRMERDGVTVQEDRRLRRMPGGEPYLIPAGRLHASFSATESWSVSLVATELAGNVPSTVIAPRSLGSASANERGKARDLPVLWSLLDGVANT
ncbi:hypothetical protein EDD27_9945 [Nonomuraea polychroma]|uniref:Uncharacterized protein n=1 Tax=Nonomuraea polychroma TaxID=46176 RepID=A0A438MN54_9ACTN|nr:hypothetical protein [Nonomuraea polychroma]RVX47025.1 hypothetical protein EDD27_9945 [Nonomuraea polychroma]